MIPRTQGQSLWDRVYNRLSFYPMPGVIRNPRLASLPMDRICEAAKADRREAQRRMAATLTPYVQSPTYGWGPTPPQTPPPRPMITQIAGKTYQLIPLPGQIDAGQSSYQVVPWPDYVTEAIADPYPGGNDDDEQEDDRQAD